MFPRYFLLQSFVRCSFCVTCETEVMLNARVGAAVFRMFLQHMQYA